MQQCCIYGKMRLTLHMLKTVKTSACLDNWGIGISLVCSVHCAAMPLILLSSAFINTQAGLLESIELPLFILAAILGTTSILQTYFRTSRAFPLLLLATGLALIIMGGYSEGYLEVAFRVLGSLSLVFAHFTNKKILKAQVK